MPETKRTNLAKRFVRFSSIDIPLQACSKPIPQCQGIGRVVVVPGFGQPRQSVLHFGPNNEMTDREVYAEPDTGVPAMNINTRTVGHGRVEQASSVESAVQLQPRALRKSERDERFDGKIEV